MKITNQDVDTANVKTILVRIATLENQLNYLFNLCDINAIRLKEIQSTCTFIVSNMSIFNSDNSPEEKASCARIYSDLSGVLNKIGKLNVAHVENLERLNKYQSTVEYVKSTMGQYASLRTNNCDSDKATFIESNFLDVTEILCSKIANMLVSYKSYDELISKLNHIVNVEIFGKSLCIES